MPINFDSDPSLNSSETPQTTPDPKDLVQDMPLDSADNLLDWMKQYHNHDYVQQLMDQGQEELPYAYNYDNLEVTPKEIQTILDRVKLQRGQNQDQIRQVLKDLSPAQIKGFLDDHETQIIPTQAEIEESQQSQTTQKLRSQDDEPYTGQLNKDSFDQIVNAAYTQLKNPDQSALGLHALAFHRSELPTEIGKRFNAHGISKGRLDDQLRSLLNFLDNGAQGSRLYQNLLKSNTETQTAFAAGASGPYDTGGFIILGQPSPSFETIPPTIHDPEKGTNISAVLVNEPFYQAIPTLQQQYPNTRFIKAQDLEPQLSQILQQTEPNS